MTGVNPYAATRPVCGVSSQNIFKLMTESTAGINPVTLPKFSGISFDTLLSKLDPRKNYVVIVNDGRIGHKYLLDFPVTNSAGRTTRPAYVIQSDLGEGVMPPLDIDVWLSKRGGDVINSQDLGRLYSDDFARATQDEQRRTLASVLQVDNNPSRVRLEALRSDRQWDFTVSEYSPEQFQSNLNQVKLKRSVPSRTS